MLRSNDWTLVPDTSFFQARCFAIDDNRRLTVEVIVLELQCRHLVIVQEVQLLDRKALHLRNDKEDPSHCDKGESGPDKPLKIVLAWSVIY
jgi:hypothetical protein